MLVAQNLHKSYGNIKVLKGLNITVNKGETVVILGRSGVGKSVLLRQIIGIELPDTGSITIEGVDIHNAPREEAAVVTKSIGMLFQGAALFDSMTVEENTGFYLSQHGDPKTGKPMPKDVISDMVAHALSMVGLEGTQKKMPSDLSGGQKKRAALARSIIYRPSIMLYDEPTTGLDPITAQHINDLINQTSDELQATNIVVTHDIRSALHIGDRLALHNDGKIAHIAPVDEFLQIEDPLLKAFFQNAIVRESELKGKGKSHD